MKAFNPEKELRKIQRGNKNKVIFTIIFGIILVTIGYSFALYQVRYSKRIIYTKVGPFNNRDINLAVYVDNNKEEHFPEKNSGYRYDHIDCDNGSTGTFDNIKWELTLTAKDKDKCDVYFVKTYKDASGANAPELYQGLIPIEYGKNGEVIVADLDDKWYDYTNAEWANAVLVDASDSSIKNHYFNSDGSFKLESSGEIIPISDIKQMYVWIPRYKYQLFNVGDKTSVSKQVIEVEFEHGIQSSGDISCQYTNNGGQVIETCLDKDGKIASNDHWYTHPAFTFKGTFDDDGTELEGIWVGKFETSGNINNDLMIVPNAHSVSYQIVSSFFTAAQNIVLTNYIKYNLKTDEVDSHLIKNIDWGAIAYLSQSKYGIYKIDNESNISCRINEMTIDDCAIWNNPVVYPGSPFWTGAITGCGGAVKDAPYVTQTQCSDGYTWEKLGAYASTSGNLYGIYDMAGGACEFVMGNMVALDGKFNTSASGFPDKNPGINTKYYDLYSYDVSNMFTFERGHLGDATKEAVQSYGGYEGAWNDDTLTFPISNSAWLLRGGRPDLGTQAGIFASNITAGGATADAVSRIVITKL